MSNITPGSYNARAKQFALGLTSTMKEQVAVQFAIVGGPLDGQTITWYGYFTEAAVERTLESLRICGWAGDDLSDLTGTEANEVQIVVEEEPDQQGVARPRVRWVNELRGPMLKSELRPDQAKAFAARMRGTVVGFNQSRGKPAAKPSGTTPQRSQSRREEPPPPSDSDMPPPF